VIKRKIFFWYIFKELLSPFALGLLIFTFVLLMNRILRLMDMVINKGIGIGEVSTLLLFLLPSLLVLTIPMSILLAVLIALGKLSADSEIIAMKSSGISLYQMLPPFALLCILGFLVTNLLTLYLLPKGNYAFKDYITELAKKHSGASLEEGVFNDAFEGMVIYINKFNREENRINGILVSDRRDPEFQNVIVAKDGIILAEPENAGVIFRLFNGSLHRLDHRSKSYHYALFDTYEMNVKLEGSGEERKLKYRELSIKDLFKLSSEREKIKKSSTRINAEIHQRFAFPFACLVFGLLGVPLGVYWRRGGRSYGFVLSIVIVFLYYLFLNIGENLAKSGYLFAFMGIWMPNVILGVLGIYLFRKVAREEQVPSQWIGLGYLEPAINRIKVWAKKMK
jgi:lipopolysaccharide export system permease protein